MKVMQLGPMPQKQGLSSRGQQLTPQHQMSCVSAGALVRN